MGKGKFRLKEPKSKVVRICSTCGWDNSIKRYRKCRGCGAILIIRKRKNRRRKGNGYRKPFQRIE